MTEQQEKELEYLKHAIRNGTTKIGGCLKEIENIVTTMGAAVQAYIEDNDGYKEKDPYP